MGYATGDVRDRGQFLRPRGLRCRIRAGGCFVRRRLVDASRRRLGGILGLGGNWGGHAHRPDVGALGANEATAFEFVFYIGDGGGVDFHPEPVVDKRHLPGVAVGR